MKKRIIKWILVVLSMGLIFYFSSKSGNDSTIQSRSIVKIYESNEENIESSDIIFRKVAHCFEYLVLTLLVCSLINEYNLSLSKTILLSFVICLAYAISDELHQLLVPGRSGKIIDVFIDGIGIIIGSVNYKLLQRRKS